MICHYNKENKISNFPIIAENTQVLVTMKIFQKLVIYDSVTVLFMDIEQFPSKIHMIPKYHLSYLKQIAIIGALIKKHKINS